MVKTEVDTFPSLNDADYAYRCELCHTWCDDDAALKQHVLPHLAYCQQVLDGRAQPVYRHTAAATTLPTGADSNTEICLSPVASLSDVTSFDAGDVKPGINTAGALDAVEGVTTSESDVSQEIERLPSPRNEFDFVNNDYNENGQCDMASQDNNPTLNPVHTITGLKHLNQAAATQFLTIDCSNARQSVTPLPLTVVRSDGFAPSDPDVKQTVQLSCSDKFRNDVKQYSFKDEQDSSTSANKDSFVSPEQDSIVSPEQDGKYHLRIKKVAKTDEIKRQKKSVTMRKTAGVGNKKKYWKELDTTQFTIDDDDKFKCTACGEAFENLHLMHRHVQQHSDKPYGCHDCGKRFKKSEGLRKHVIAEHTDDPALQCATCRLSFESVERLERHRRLKHTDPAQCFKIIDGVKKYYKYLLECKVCEKKFCTTSSLRAHQLVHTGEKPFTCEVCGKAFRQRYYVKIHMLSHSESKQFKCDLCDKYFSNDYARREHMQRRHGTRKFACDQCTCAYATKKALKRHNVEIHLGLQKRVACSECGKSFRGNAVLQQHMRTHTGERPFQCEQCGAAFKQKAQLNMHVERVHQEQPTLQCEFCSKLFTSVYSFNRHRRLHMPESCHACAECGKLFTTVGLLRNHMRVHTGEKRYQCNVCDKKLSTSTGLKNHKLIHTGEKPFKCEYCGSTWRHKSQLSEHVKTHVGEKKHQCKLCSKMFLRPHYLRSHLQTHARHEEQERIAAAAAAAAATAGEMQ